jgi:DNA-binding MarR family transcriptional regulator
VTIDYETAKRLQDEARDDGAEVSGEDLLDPVAWWKRQQRAHAGSQFPEEEWAGAVAAAPRLATPAEVAERLGLDPASDEVAEATARENAGRQAEHDQVIAERIKSREQYEYINQRARDQAQRRYRNELGDQVEVPEGASLTDLLRKERPPTRWLVEGVWRRGGVILLAAQAKAGKTTLRDNAIRSLVDGDPFLGVHRVVDADDCVVGVIDFELDEDEFIDWLAKQNIRNTDSVRCWSLRGKAHLFDLRNERVQQRWVERLRAACLRVLMVDCLSPILSALGIAENDNQQVGEILDAILRIATEAEIRELLVIHHLGHAAERARGASRLRGWPDAEWLLVRQKPDDPMAEPEPDSPRFFSAYGRKVDVRQGQLVFDEATHRLVYVGGTRQQAAANNAMVKVLAYIASNDGKNAGEIEGALAADKTLSRDAARDTRKAAIAAGYVEELPSKNRAKRHSLTVTGRAKLAELTMTPHDPDDPWETYCALCQAYILPLAAAAGRTLCDVCEKASSSLDEAA